MNGYSLEIDRGILKVTCTRCSAPAKRKFFGRSTPEIIVQFSCGTSETDPEKAVEIAEGHTIHLAEHERNFHGGERK